MIRFRLTRTPRPLLALPPADDPDLPAPRPPNKLAASPGKPGAPPKPLAAGKRGEQTPKQ